MEKIIPLPELLYRNTGKKKPFTWEREECLIADTTKLKNVANETEDLELMLKGQSKECDLNSLFRFENYPKLGNIKEDFIESMEAFEGKMKGFAKGNTLVYGVESRTSSPLRILRDENFRCMEKDIYPCGEGAGYAGGIMSAAMDGMKVAEAYIRSLQNRG